MAAAIPPVPEPACCEPRLQRARAMFQDDLLARMTPQSEFEAIRAGHLAA